MLNQSLDASVKRAICNATLRYVLGLLVTALIGCCSVEQALAAEDDSAIPADFRKEVKETVDLYQRWGLRRKVRTYRFDHEISFDITIAEAEAEVSARVATDLYLHDGEKYRVENTDDLGIVNAYCYDGEIARFRNRQITHNGKRLPGNDFWNDMFIPDLPHFAVARLGSLSSFRFLFGEPVFSERLSAFNRMLNIKVSTDTQEGHPCWKVGWTSVNVEGGAAQNTVWLARDRGLLPIRLVTDESFGREISLWHEFRIKEFEQLQVGARTLWMPVATVAIRKSGVFSTCKLGLCELNTDLTDAQQFSVLHPLDPVWQKTRNVKAGSYIPFSLFDSLALTATRYSGPNKLPHLRWWFFGSLAFVAIVFTLSILFWTRKTSLGKKAGVWVSSSPMIVGFVGLCLCGLVFYACGQPKGWHRHGFPLVATSVCGVVLIGISMLFTGKKAISLKTILVLSGCAALFFAGYNKGLRRLQSRQQMIQDIREAGGHLQLINWESKTDGIAMPGPMSELVDESWSSTMTAAAIPAEIFSEVNVSQWSLDEGGFLGVGRVDFKTFEVDSRPLRVLAGASTIWGLHFERGSLDEECIDALGFFPSLEFIAFDCRHEQLSNDLVTCTQLNKIQLDRPLVDDAFFDTLAQLPKLEELVLSRPQFQAGTDVARCPELKRLTVQYATVSGESLEALGTQSAWLRFENCKFPIKPGRELRLPETLQIEFRDGEIDDRKLTQLKDLPKLRSMMLDKTNVTYKGFEAYSIKHPGVEIGIN